MHFSNLSFYIRETNPLMMCVAGFSPVILLLLRVQSFLDAIACLFGALVTIPTPMWKTHICK